MSDEKQVYTMSELEELSRVDLRKLAVKGWGMNNVECSETKSAGLREYIIKKQEEEQEGGEEETKTSSKKAERKGGMSRPSSSKASPKAGARGGKKAAPKEKATREERKEEKEEEEEIDTSNLSGRIDLIGKTLDENHEDIKNVIAVATEEDFQGIKEALKSIRMTQFVMYGLISDIYRNYYEPDDLDSRADDLEKEFSDTEGNA